MKKPYLKLKGRIMACGFTQEQVANSIGITQQALSMKLNGKTRWTVPEMYIVGEVLRVKSADDLLSLFPKC